MMQEVEMSELASAAPLRETAPAATAWSVVRVANRPSLLDTEFAGEILEIILPTSTCMFLVIFLVRLLNVGQQDFSASTSLGQAYYHEQQDDSVAEKLEGAAINGAIFVACITAATFGIFLLFKYNCSKVIWGIMGVSGVSVFFLFVYTIVLRVLQEADVHMDQISFYFLMWNFCVGGVVSVFFWPGPLTAKQGNLICIATATAYIFCRLPEWSTFLLLIALALYDLAAVLLPMGPLKILVDLAIERDESIPALVYEARGHQAKAPPPPTPPTAPLRCAATSPPLPPTVTLEPEFNLDEDSEPLLSAEEMQSLVATDDSGGGDNSRGSGVVSLRDPEGATERQVAHEVSGRLRHEGIKLGLGDFIFYSVLVGRAAMYDMVPWVLSSAMTAVVMILIVYYSYDLRLTCLTITNWAFNLAVLPQHTLEVTAFATYLAIVAGLVMTLLLLAVFQKALPALPISIFAGIAFYLMGRLVLDPFVVGVTSNLLYF